MTTRTKTLKVHREAWESLAGVRNKHGVPIVKIINDFTNSDYFYTACEHFYSKKEQTKAKKCARI